MFISVYLRVTFNYNNYFCINFSVQFTDQECNAVFPPPNWVGGCGLGVVNSYIKAFLSSHQGFLKSNRVVDLDAGGNTGNVQIKGIITV